MHINIQSQDIYYRLGRIESDIEHIRSDINSLKGSIEKMQGSIVKIQETLQNNSKELRAEILGSVGLWFSMMAVFVAFCSIFVPLMINFFINRDRKYEEKPRTQTQPQPSANNFFVTDFNSFMKFFKSESQNNNN